MKLLEEVLKKLIAPPEIPVALERFRLLREEIKKRNEVVNLTAITDDDGIEVRHFIDSLAAIAAGIGPDDSLLDVGAGAGLPGLAMKIALPRLKLSLAESVQKKAAFIVEAARALGFADVKVYPIRSEDLPRQLRETFDIVCARALAKPPAAAELMLPWVRVGGRCLLYAASSVKPEELSGVCAALGGEVSGKISYALPPEPSRPREGVLDRKLIIIRKSRPTPTYYPRRAGLAAKTPVV
jgi:16S rRNA (guanine527-N7)-methyltransferase